MIPVPVDLIQSGKLGSTPQLTIDFNSGEVELGRLNGRILATLNAPPKEGGLGEARLCRADGASHLNAARLTVRFAQEEGQWRMAHFQTENLFSRPVTAWNSEAPLPVPER